MHAKARMDGGQSFRRGEQNEVSGKNKMKLQERTTNKKKKGKRKERKFHKETPNQET